MEHVALLVTGRRGPFPSYRFNGVYTPTSDLSDCRTAFELRRTDRPEVAIRKAPEDPDWRCFVDGSAVARGTTRLPRELSDAQIVAEVLETEGFRPDPGVVLLAFPPASAQALHNDEIRCQSCLPRRQDVTLRPLSALRPPVVVSPELSLLDALHLAVDGAAERRYTIWGTAGSANCLTDLLQGDSGNCGILAAIDALAHRDPQGCLSRVLEQSKENKTITARLYDPSDAHVTAWTLGSLSSGGSSPSKSSPSDKAPQAPHIAVVSATAVPRFVRSLTERAWGILVEAALAEMAGGYAALAEREPNVAWLALGGPGVVARRYFLWPRKAEEIATSRWTCSISRVKAAPQTVTAAMFHRLERSTSSRSSRWRRASERWQFQPGADLSHAEIEALLETSVAKGLPVCLYPKGTRESHPERGEPSVEVPVCFAVRPSSTLQVIRFVVNHAYSVRNASRFPVSSISSSDGLQTAPENSNEPSDELWLQLRDPRRVRLFWASWKTVLHTAAEGICGIYVAESGFR